MLTTILLYLMIPIVAGLIGWGTNVLAIRMIFSPLQYVGRWPFGWQGIIPSKARKMATICADLVTERLICVEALFQKLDPERVSQELEPVLRKMSQETVDQVIASHYPNLWEMLPHTVKERTFAKIEEEIPATVARIVVELRSNIREIVDARALVIDAFVRDKALLNQLFERCGAEEFKFIGRSGLYFGLLFGLVQMTLWIFYKAWWLLPSAGLLVGYATNWLALKMVFEPLQPKRFGPFRWQGVFLKRQDVVAHEYARVFAAEVFKPANIVDAVLKGPASDRLVKLIQRQLSQTIDGATGIGKPLVVLVSGTARYQAMKREICERLIQRLPESLHSLYDYAAQALDLQGEVEGNLKSLSSKEFEQVLRPIFQEDEWTLILIGAVLGGLAGALQLVLFL